VRVRAQVRTRQVPVLEQVKELEPVPLGRELDRQAWAQQEQAQEQARSERFRLRV